MKRTSDTNSKERQRLGRELRIWREALRAARAGLAFDDAAREVKGQRVGFCRAEIKKIEDTMAEQLRSGRLKRQFWHKKG